MELKRKYMFYQKLCETKFVDLFETTNFVFLRFFRISNIIVKKLNFGFSIIFFLIKKKNMHLMKKCYGNLLSIVLYKPNNYTYIYDDTLSSNHVHARLQC